MITRDFGDGGWAAGGQFNPPPLHVYDTESEYAAWHPLQRPALPAQPPGPAYIFDIPSSPFGDDPTDPSAQTVPRIPTRGMIGRLHPEGC